MSVTSVSNIDKDYYISNKKIYPKNNKNYKISNNVKFDSYKFAQWLKSVFQESPYKTITAFAKAVESNKATISRLMSDAPQTLTGKPSQPKPDLVERIAVKFGKDVNEALMLAGHAPKGVTKPDVKTAADFAEFLKQYDVVDYKLTPEDMARLEETGFDELIDYLKMFFLVKIQRHENVVSFPSNLGDRKRKQK